MRKLALATFLLSLPLAFACSADWKDGEGGPDSQDGETDGGATDGGATDGGTETDGGGSDGGGSDGGGSDGGSDGGGTDGGATDDDGDGWTEDDGDCDDTDPTVYPGAEELCDGQLNDCDGTRLTGESSDGDGDGVLDCNDFCPVQVDDSAATGGDGSFARPTTSVQDGIDIAGATGCLQVEVHPGLYLETVDYGGINADVYSVAGPEETTIDASGAGSVVTFASGETSGAKLRGFTITGGSAERGGGIHVDASDPVIDGNIITDNAADAGRNLGGGIYLYDSDATITDNVIRGNDAGYRGVDDGNDGGGVAILYGGPLVQLNWILDNTAGDGGGIWVVHGDAIIANNLVDGNAADDQGHTDDAGGDLYGQGGGIDIQTDTQDVLVTANVVTNNMASSHGGGVALIGYYQESDVANATVANNVIAYNSLGSGSFGAGLCVWGWSAPTVYNNAIVNNDGVGVYTAYDYLDFSYNDVYGNSTDYSGALGTATGTDGNISVNPAFTSVSDNGDGTDDDFSLRSTSGLVDAGDPAVSDPDGTRSDIGAFGGAYGAW